MRVNSDPYRLSSYAWEIELFSKERTTCSLSIEDAETLMERACGRAVPPTMKTLRSNSRRAYSANGEKTIALPAWGRNPIVLLHEIAHQVLSDRERRTGQRVVPHGAEWLWVFHQLLVKLGGQDLAMLRLTAKMLHLPLLTPEQAAQLRLPKLI